MTLLLLRFFLLLLIVCPLLSFSQDSTQRISAKYFDVVSRKANSLEQKLDKKSEEALNRLQKQEIKMKRKLAKIDSLAANNVFTSAEEKYKQLGEKLKNSTSLSQYLPYLDTLKTSFKFLEQNPQWIGEGKEKLTETFSKVKELETQFQKAEDIKQFLKERQQYLREQLEKSGTDSYRYAKELKKLNKQVYYYSQQLNEYKTILKDPKKIERKIIDLLAKTKAFQDFMKKNCMLASLFRMPGDPNYPAYQASLAGLQTRAQVNALIQNQIAIGGPGAQQQVQNNIQQAQAQLQQLKDRVNKFGGGSSDDIIPERFKPNNQKTKSFFQRLELGTNMQTQRATNFYPVVSDIGLSIGYKPNDNSVIGVGASYKMGWGSGWNNIRITHQGVGLRSFIDWKLKGSFWVSGGYEQNYKNEIRRIDQLKDYSAWQSGGLIGVSKVISMRSKLFKKTKMQLLWDFLSYQQVPRAQPVVFRIGYGF